jgi:hypothetical protein
MGGAGAVLSTFRVALPTTCDGIERNRSPKYATASRWIPTTRLPANKDLREVENVMPSTATARAYQPLQPRRADSNDPSTSHPKHLGSAIPWGGCGRRQGLSLAVVIVYSSNMSAIARQLA